MNVNQQTSEVAGQASGQRYPVSNFLYDVATLIHERCKGLEVLSEYERDAQQGGHNAFLQLAQKMRQQDEEIVRELEQILAGQFGHAKS
jgi:hypothetical protein